MKSIAKNPINENSTRVFIGLGSNLGDRAAWLAAAHERLATHAAIAIVKASALYETAAYGFREQPAFLNQVIEIATTLPAPILLESLLRIENELGRMRTQRWGPRNIDLDLLAYGEFEIATEHLCVPHSEIPRRRFVLLPWQELAPEFIVPKWRLSVAELLAQCEDESAVMRWQE